MFHLYCWRPIYKERYVYSYCVCLRAFQLLIPLWHILKYDQGLTPLLHPDNGGRSTSMNNGVVTYATDDLITSSSKIRDLVSMWKSWTDSNTVMMMIFKTCIIASWSWKMTQHACFRVFFLPLPPLTKRKKQNPHKNHYFFYQYTSSKPSHPTSLPHHLAEKLSTCYMLPSKSSASVHPSYHRVAVRIAAMSDYWRRRRVPRCVRVRRVEEQNVQNTWGFEFAVPQRSDPKKILTTVPGPKPPSQNISWDGMRWEKWRKQVGKTDFWSGFLKFQTIFLKYKIWVNEFKKWNSSEILSFDWSHHQLG